MSRVTEYKVCKAIANGVPLHLETLVMATQQPTSEVLAVLVKLDPEKFGIPGVDTPHRKQATVDELVAYARRGYPAGVSLIDAILKLQNYAMECGCLGPRDGDPLCRCLMRAQLYTHKAAVAARLMELELEDSE